MIRTVIVELKEPRFIGEPNRAQQVSEVIKKAKDEGYLVMFASYFQEGGSLHCAMIFERETLTKRTWSEWLHTLIGW